MANSAIGIKILNLANQSIGRRIGKGATCWSFVEAALKYAKAKSSRDLTQHFSTRDAEYVWGELVPIAKALPGDILQFINHQEVHKDGQTYSRKHHSAIVYVSLSKSGYIEIFEQHLKGTTGVVTRKIYPFSCEDVEVSGQVKSYRAIPLSK